VSLVRQDFDHLLRRARGGSHAAVEELIEHYRPYVVRVVRRRLHKRLRSLFDSSDFVQTVWTSFFADPAKLASFEDPESLLRYLAVMARNKVVEEFRRRFQTEKRDVKREHLLESSSVDRSAALAAKQPTPSEFAVANERWDGLVEGQPNRYQEILRLRAEGFNCQETALLLNLNEKTVRRVIKKLEAEHMP
jgi:RNA polymerase sigma factor (sigma-70 family)